MSALSPAEAFSCGLEAGGGRWRLALDCGRELAVPFRRFTGDASAGERRLLARAAGPVLDIGCGPGRHVAALVARGVPALGIDASPHAVGLALDRGAPVALGSVFGPVPAEGTWATALLLDGNLGIGGDPVALLARTAELLRIGGTALVECTLPADLPAGRRRARLVGPAGASASFPWALVDAGELARAAAAAGFAVHEAWEDEGRRYAALAVAP